MTAIDPQKIEFQINQLLEYASQPDQFIHHLQNFLEYYQDRVYRPGLKSDLPALLTSYHVPLPLIRELEKKLSIYSKSNPEQALLLANSLWIYDYIEFKSLAISILKSTPLSYSSSKFIEIKKWITNCKNQNILNQLSDSILEQFLPSEPLILINQIESWIRDNHLSLKKFGYQILRKSIEKYPFDYLPVVYKVIHPSLYETSPWIQNEITEIFAELAKRSPKETAYLLQNSYQSKPHPNIKRIIRKTFLFYPDDQKDELEKIRNQN